MKSKMVGKKFGRLIVIGEVGRNKYAHILWKCLCDCGKFKIIVGNDLRSGHTKSCGCLQKEIVVKRNATHGMTGTRTHESWRGMLARCLNSNNTAYSNYGGRGIMVCKQWREFKNFFKDMGECPKGLSIERIDNSKGYLPDNCKWATSAEQNRNKRLDKRNKTGTSGVYWDKQSQKYKVGIGENGKWIHLGFYSTLEQAIAIRKVGEKECWGKK